MCHWLKNHPVGIHIISYSLHGLKPKTNIPRWIYRISHCSCWVSRQTARRSLVPRPAGTFLEWREDTGEDEEARMLRLNKMADGRTHVKGFRWHSLAAMMLYNIWRTRVFSSVKQICLLGDAIDGRVISQRCNIAAASLAVTRRLSSFRGLDFQMLHKFINRTTR